MGRNAKPWYRPPTDAWYATIGGRQVRLAKGKENLAEAKKEFHRKMAAEAESVKQAKALPLGGLADMFLSHVRGTYADSAIQRPIDYVMGFVAHVGKLKPSRDIKPHHLTKWLESRNWNDKPWNGTTQSSAIRAVKRMYNWAIEEGYLDENPIADMKLPRSKRREAIMTGSQADAALAAVKQAALKEMMIALRETGCRPREVRTLTIDRINLDAGTWQVIDKSRNKTGEECRTIYLSAKMIELSRELRERHGEGIAFRNSAGGQWTKSTLVKAFCRLRGEMEYGAEFTAYAYRHLYVTDALERGVSPATLAELVGHTDMQMIMRVYSKLRHRTDHLREAAESARKTPSASRQDEGSPPKPT